MVKKDINQHKTHSTILKTKKLSLSTIRNLNFYEPDFKKFPALKLGWEALQNPCCSPIVLNAANEIAVDSFLKNKIKFTDIYYVVYETLNFYNPSVPNGIDDVMEIDRISRIKSLELIKRKHSK